MLISKKLFNKPNPLALSIHLLCASAALPFAAFANAQNDSAASPQQWVNTKIDYKISASPLATALNEFAAQSNLLISGSSQLTQGKNSPGLTGSYTPQEALALLLNETGLSYQVADGKKIILEQKRETGALKTVKVSANTLDGSTEGSGSYTVAAMNTAALLPLSSRETPQSVTVVTRQQIDDQKMIKASDALKYIPGITPHSNSGPNRETYFSRGFIIENFTYDGLPAAYTTAGGHGLLNDMAIYDRVEVVRGATGLSQGTGSPSATINFVRKRPTSTFQASVEGTVGQWDYYGATADVSGPLSQTASVRGRAVVSASTSDSFQDVVGEERSVLYAIGEVDLSENTMLTTAVSYQSNSDISTWAGLPTAQDGSSLNLPRSTFVGNDWNYWDTENTSAFANIEHHFANDWKIVGALNYIDVDQARCVTGIFSNDIGSHDLNGNCGEDKLKRTSFDMRAQGPFELFGRKHDLVVGGASRKATEDGAVAGYGLLSIATDIDIENWTHDAPKPNVSELIDYYYNGKTRERGIYSTARFNISDPLKLIVGARADWFKYTFKGDYFDSWETFEWQGWTEDFDYDKHITKYAGVTYEMTKQMTLYTSYTDIFQPQGARDKNGNEIDPIVGKNYEVGVKGSFADDTLELDAALFRIDQDNIAVSDLVACPPPGPGCSRPAGLQRSEGFDIGLLGRLTPSWEIAAGYTYTNLKTIRNADDPSTEGRPVDTHLPRRLVKATTTYRLPGDKWRIGGGLRWQSDVHHYDDWMGYDYRTEQKAYTIVDAMISYAHSDNLSFQLNATNLLDKTYWRVINTQPVEWGGNALYGEPRKIMLTAKYNF